EGAVRGAEIDADEEACHADQGMGGGAVPASGGANRVRRCIVRGWGVFTRQPGERHVSPWSGFCVGWAFSGGRDFGRCKSGHLPAAAAGCQLTEADVALSSRAESGRNGWPRDGFVAWRGRPLIGAKHLERCGALGAPDRCYNRSQPHSTVLQPTKTDRI